MRGGEARQGTATEPVAHRTNGHDGVRANGRTWRTDPVSRVELRLDAAVENLPLLRLVAGDLAMRRDHDIDTISDVQMAVDEAAAALLDVIVGADTLCCRFEAGPDVVRVSLEAWSAAAVGPDQNSLGWRLLTALVDSVRVSVTAAAGGGHRVCVEFARTPAGSEAP
ncbi:serine/threonine-protein kinase RsbW [Streptoalloteichus tenebrarius]|uniref:Serine/threonine-protein kinase RsbW n=1 Tax=Streptoalloteichus tenebrarius (strain ATCC 17920 / DSM 40477 / JCM 4838 / CBS 697.72 / NBRC 16177 / NCIMB 11028 / NRRL B-12390 / A12253. 1 / ISP 5477) TaxID=1933 RepID=A0ABT1HSL2_STRSD|nr:anti-sigma factor [Streptoalloteichus tenebrarius]MCP2258504.1 serine/threonine-protein kinase RsbW [Streptoalloteichus tenebrarius]BFF04134.1 hypothetical protein GCM10020241_58090 [Streptoalloteichus tenebrarius]